MLNFRKSKNTTLKKLTSLIMSVLFLLTCFTGCSNSADKEKDDVHFITEEEYKENNSETSEFDVEILEYGDVEDGNAIITFLYEDITYTGIVNSSGKIFYYTEEDSNNWKWQSIGNGAGYIERTTENISTYTIFDSNGKSTFTTENNPIFDDVYGYGDGTILVHKDVSTISKNQQSYGVIDAHGNWIAPMTAGCELQKPSSSLGEYSAYKHYGEGVFISSAYYGFSNHVSIYSSKNNKNYYLDDAVILGESLIAGELYGKISSYHGYIKSPNLNSPSEELPEYFALKTDGTSREIPKFENIISDMYVDTSGKYLEIKDIKTNNTHEYRNYKSELIAKVSSLGEYFLIQINGQDNNNYFTVIDKNCNEKFTPISYEMTNPYTPISFCKERIVYQNPNKKYVAIDLSGNVIISEKEGYTYIGDLGQGFALAEKNDKNMYLKPDGSVLNVKLVK